MAAVDRYGFELAVTKPEGPRATRLAFDEPVATKDEIRGAMIEMVERARSMIPTGDDRAER